MFLPSFLEWLILMLIPLGVIWGRQYTGGSIFLSSLFATATLSLLALLVSLGNGLGFGGSLAMACVLFVFLFFILTTVSSAMFGVWLLIRRLWQAAK